MILIDAMYTKPIIKRCENTSQFATLGDYYQYIYIGDVMTLRPCGPSPRRYNIIDPRITCTVNALKSNG